MAKSWVKFVKLGKAKSIRMADYLGGGITEKHGDFIFRLWLEGYTKFERHLGPHWDDTGEKIENVALARRLQGLPLLFNQPLRKLLWQQSILYFIFSGILASFTAIVLGLFIPYSSSGLTLGQIYMLRQAVYYLVVGTGAALFFWWFDQAHSYLDLSFRSPDKGARKQDFASRAEALKQAAVKRLSKRGPRFWLALKWAGLTGVMILFLIFYFDIAKRFVANLVTAWAVGLLIFVAMGYFFITWSIKLFAEGKPDFVVSREELDMADERLFSPDVLRFLKSERAEVREDQSLGDNFQKAITLLTEIVGNVNSFLEYQEHLKKSVRIHFVGGFGHIFSEPLTPMDAMLRGAQRNGEITQAKATLIRQWLSNMVMIANLYSDPSEKMKLEAEAQATIRSFKAQDRGEVSPAGFSVNSFVLNGGLTPDFFDAMAQFRNVFKPKAQELQKIIVQLSRRAEVRMVPSNEENKDRARLAANKAAATTPPKFPNPSPVLNILEDPSFEEELTFYDIFRRPRSRYLGTPAFAPKTLLVYGGLGAVIPRFYQLYTDIFAADYNVQLVAVDILPEKDAWDKIKREKLPYQSYIQVSPHKTIDQNGEGLEKALSLKPSGVLIVTRPDTHLDIIQWAVDHHLKVFVEKPPVLPRQVPELKRIYAANKQNILFVDFFLDNPAMHKALGQLHPANIGEIRAIRGKMLEANPIEKGRDWLVNPTISGGGMGMDMLVHLIAGGELILDRYGKTFKSFQLNPARTFFSRYEGATEGTETYAHLNGKVGDIEIDFEAGKGVHTSTYYLLVEGGRGTFRIDLGTDSTNSFVEFDNGSSFIHLNYNDKDIGYLATTLKMFRSLQGVSTVSQAERDFRERATTVSVTILDQAQKAIGDVYTSYVVGEDPNTAPGRTRLAGARPVE
ncbi:MAG: hypothetical protein HYS56_01000, partial [Candidatus Omnitrophica bacterium]|nr:hypothetical protein [Candidatus Omnitrophota bacterium]